MHSNQKNKNMVKKTKLPKLVKSLNELAIDAICPNISLYDDRLLRFANSLSTYDYLDVANYTDNPDMVLAMLTKSAFNMLFATSDLSFSKLVEYVEKIFFSIFDTTPVNLKKITNNTVRMSRVYDEVSNILLNAKHVLANTVVYKTTGINKRESYSFILDLIFVNSENELSFLIIVPTAKPYNSEPLRLSKFVLSLDYLIELNLTTTRGYIVHIAKDNPDHYLFASVGITDYVLQHVAKYKEYVLPSKASTHFCGMCPYKNNCRNSNY